MSTNRARRPTSSTATRSVSRGRPCARTSTSSARPIEGVELLFDLRNDPHEQRNVAADPAYADALHAMRHELLRRWFTVENQYPLRTGRY